MSGAPSPSRRHFVRSTRGVETIEAAIALPLMMMVLFTGFEYSWALLRTLQLDHAAKVGARCAALDGYTAADVEAKVKSSLGTLGITTATVTVEPAQPELAAPGTAITVLVTVPYGDVGLLGLHRLMPLPNALSGRGSTVREPQG